MSAMKVRDVCERGCAVDWCMAYYRHVQDGNDKSSSNVLILQIFALKHCIVAA